VPLTLVSLPVYATGPTFLPLLEHRCNWRFGIACRRSAIALQFQECAGNDALIVSVPFSEVISHMGPNQSRKKGRGF
jgi:hypothetical protein